MDLLDLLKRPEGKTLEFKPDLSSPDGALKTIVAFANTAGGILLIGVEDRGRNVRGVGRISKTAPCSDFFLGIWDGYFPLKQAERQLATTVDWGRRAELFEYDAI
jgi:hypothetical protein